MLVFLIDGVYSNAIPFPHKIFENLKTENIYAICDVENIGSKNVLEKTGLKLIETFNHRDKEHNLFKMTKTEWLIKSRTANRQP